MDAIKIAGGAAANFLDLGGGVKAMFINIFGGITRGDQVAAVVVCGEIGGTDEEDAAAFIHAHMRDKPVVAFIGGRSAPAGKRLGHAGAIISGSFGTPESKLAAFAASGVPVADRPSEIPSLIARALDRVAVAL